VRLSWELAEFAPELLLLLLPCMGLLSCGHSAVSSVRLGASNQDETSWFSPDYWLLSTDYFYARHHIADFFGLST
jgi:hypothetical protein